jgi:hypothetical protein
MRKILVLCLAICFVFALAAWAVDGPATTTVNGYVSDNKCGVKGASATHAACAQKCIAGGAQAVIVTDGDQKVLTVDNPDTLKGHEGHHVAVTGTVTNDTIHVGGVKML